LRWFSPEQLADVAHLCCALYVAQHPKIKTEHITVVDLRGIGIEVPLVGIVTRSVTIVPAGNREKYKKMPVLAIGHCVRCEV